jgi:hypothetical protein
VTGAWSVVRSEMDPLIRGGVTDWLEPKHESQKSPRNPLLQYIQVSA